VAMDADDVLMGGCALSLSREPAESRPGCEDLLQPWASGVFTNGAVFESEVDRLADGTAGEQRLQKPVVFAFEPLVVHRILMTVDSEKNPLRRQHGDSADVPGLACDAGIIAGRVAAAGLVAQFD
jgi:hypothetical protein